LFCHTAESCYYWNFWLFSKPYLCRTELVGKANEAFQALGIRPPLQIARLENKSKPLKEPQKPEYIDLMLFSEMEGL